MRIIGNNFGHLGTIAAFIIMPMCLVGCEDQQVRESNSKVTTNKNEFNAKSIEELAISNRPALYKDSCGICHAIWKTDNHLAGIVDRLGRDYLKLYITKQDSLLAAKDEYAVKIKRVYGNGASVHNYLFTDEQLDSIIYYLQDYSR